MLVAYFKHQGANDIGAAKPEARTALATERVARVLPGLEQHLTQTLVKVWAEDPWAGGACLQFLPGQLYDLKPHFAQAEGRIHFAGDHTSHLPGWMQGALHSGRRVAAELRQLG